MRPGATFEPTGDVPDDHGAAMSVDLTATARLGFDYRINRRWIAGLTVGATQAIPFGGPSFQSVEGQLEVAYYWYPLW